MKHVVFEGPSKNRLVNQVRMGNVGSWRLPSVCGFVAKTVKRGPCNRAEHYRVIHVLLLGGALCVLGMSLFHMATDRYLLATHALLDHCISRLAYLI